MREGSPGDACYVIVAGEVRVEVERPDFDSNGVVSFMGPGAVCGELGLLDDSPRSASVYAHTDVTARRLTAGALRELCDRDPQAGVMMLRWLARSAAEKARAFSKDLEEFIFTDEPDPVVDELIARSGAARRSIADWSEVRATRMSSPPRLSQKPGSAAWRTRWKRTYSGAWVWRSRWSESPE
jgi:acetaldehyde dehydrogenase/alcohol dehydrogenase